MYNCYNAGDLIKTTKLDYYIVGNKKEGIVLDNFIIDAKVGNTEVKEFFGEDFREFAYIYKNRAITLRIASVNAIFGKKIDVDFLEQQGFTNLGPFDESIKNYTRLEYITGTGTQWIDTGYAGASNMKIDLTIALTTTSGDQKFFGSYGGGGGVAIGLLGGKWRLGNSWQNNSIKATTEKTRFIIEGSEWDVNGTKVKVHDLAASGGGTFTLFKVRYAGNVVDISYLSFYGLKIYEGDVLIHDFIPIKADTGEIGVYDLINGKFHRNRGSGVFIAGPEVEK